MSIGERLGLGGDSDDGPDHTYRVVPRDPNTMTFAQRPDDVDASEWRYESEADAPTEAQFRGKYGEKLDPTLQYLLCPQDGPHPDPENPVWTINAEHTEQTEDDRLARLESKVDQLAEDGTHAVEDIGDLAVLKALDGELSLDEAEKIVSMRSRLEAARSADGSLAEAVDDPTDTKEVAGRTMLQMADGYSDFSELIEDVTGGLLGGAQSAVGPGATQRQQQPQQPQGEAQQQGQPQHQPEQQPATERTSPLRAEFEANREQADDAADATADAPDHADAATEDEAAAVEADLADASARQRDAERAAAGDESKGAARSENPGDAPGDEQATDAPSEPHESSDRGLSDANEGDEERTEPQEPSDRGLSDTDDAADPDPDGDAPDAPDAPDARDDERRGMTAGPSQATEAEIAAESEVAASADVVERAATDNGTGPDDTTDAPDAGEAGSPDQCRFVKDDGEQCQNAARPDGYCWVEGHGPTDADTDDTEAATDGGTA